MCVELAATASIPPSASSTSITHLVRPLPSTAADPRPHARAAHFAPPPCSHRERYGWKDRKNVCFFSSLRRAMRRLKLSIRAPRHAQSPTEPRQPRATRRLLPRAAGAEHLVDPARRYGTRGEKIEGVQRGANPAVYHYDSRSSRGHHPHRRRSAVHRALGGRSPPAVLLREPRERHA